MYLFLNVEEKKLLGGKLEIAKISRIIVSTK